MELETKNVEKNVDSNFWEVKIFMWSFFYHGSCKTCPELGYMGYHGRQ